MICSSSSGQDDEASEHEVTYSSDAEAEVSYAAQVKHLRIANKFLSQKPEAGLINDKICRVFGQLERR